MKIIITGGAGFIGSNFIFYEMERHPEDRIICLDKLTYAGNIKTLQSALGKANFRFVPLQDFSKPWTDAELYAKYGLTEDEIAFIESMIKPME